MEPIYKCRICGAYTTEPFHCNTPARLLLDEKTRVRVSKLISGLLRHFPEKGNLKPDDEGYVELKDLAKAIKTLKPELAWITENHIVAIALLDRKGRFHIKGNKIAATYGHSYAVKRKYDEVQEVGDLYHGTVEARLPSILKEGLKPVKRLYVHLTNDLEEAWRNASRWRGKPVVLVIDGKGLVKSGAKIFRGSHKIFLTRHVPPRFIKKVLHK